MEKEVKTIGLSRDFIIHPGETLAEVLEDREMTQKELAIRTGMSEKHISTVINGQKNISSSFAKKLEYALGIETEFWMNLQANYERELLDFEELNNISEQELEILKNLKEVYVHESLSTSKNTGSGKANTEIVIEKDSDTCVRADSNRLPTVSWMGVPAERK